MGGFAAIELTHAGGAGVGGEFDGGGELAGEGVELAAGIGARGVECRGRVAGMRLSQAFGEFAEFADALRMGIAYDAGGEGGAYRIQDASGELTGAVKEGGVGFRGRLRGRCGRAGGPTRATRGGCVRPD